MAIDNNTRPVTLAMPIVSDFSRTVTESLLVAQKEQALIPLKEKKQQENQLNGLKNTPSVELDPPEVSTSSGEFYDTIIIALSRLSGLLGDMADSTLIDLQFNREEIKRLLKEKLLNAEASEKRRVEQEKAEERAIKRENELGFWSKVADFAFGAFEYVTGLATMVKGVFTLNPADIAAGASLAVAGLLEMSAAFLEEGATKDNLKMAANTFMGVGLALSFVGSGPMVAFMIKGVEKALKSGGKKLIQEAAEKASKEVSEKAMDDIAKTAMKEASKQAAKGLKSQMYNLTLEVFSRGTTKTLKSGMNKHLDEYAEVFMKTVAKETTKRGFGEVSEEMAKKATQNMLKNLKKELQDNVQKLSDSTKVFRNLGKAALAKEALVQSHNIHAAVVQEEFDARKADLEKEKDILLANLEEITHTQEWVNNLIKLLQEHWTRAVTGPVEEAMKVLNSSIQDRGNTSKRIAASFSV
ncbi:type III secretion system translocon subunit SctE [Marinibactrum halimedae]|uniref:Translocator protein BipB-like C-terminal domain-containing protein n=1 Tax=Marinibactrum halimedae TaxID=1444977 RepID=A0AA37WK91_9GAMM|nr:type III secretion system translocon subunit SctE [Marinibactrum halimedae]MCD9459062.1 type III secretion system translocon subunit SctE [Marinibactrum halimedae]GLS24663.1 hypothetical protein GCM10007877_03770 [Marinibactrum halimedae]